jgi:Tol biopolymer transport system component
VRPSRGRSTGFRVGLRGVASDTIRVRSDAPRADVGEWPSGKAPDSGSGDRRFESFLPSQHPTNRDTGLTTLVTVGIGGSANGASDQAAISADGSTIAFRSAASNLVGIDTNGVSDVFVMDRASSVVTRVSVGAGGAQADGASGAPDLDAMGATVAFDSLASNLVAGDTNAFRDVFLHDRAAAETIRVSVAWDGAQGDADSWGPSIAGNGTVLAFVSDAGTFDSRDLNTLADIYAVNLAWSGAWAISLGVGFQAADGPSWAPSISSDGVRVAFVSDADLVADDGNGSADAFVHDLNRERTWRWTLTALDQESNGQVTTAAISGDAGVLAFVSAAADLVAGDTNSVSDVFLRLPE